MTNVRQNGVFKGFRARIFWTLTTLVLALTVILTVMVIYQQGKLLKEDLVSRGLSISRNLAHDSQLGIFTESSDYLDPVIKRNIGLERDFVYVVVYNHQGKVISVHTTEKGFKPNITRELIQGFYAEPAPFWQETVQKNDRVYEFWAPVLVSKGFKAEDLVLDMETGRTTGGPKQKESLEGKRLIGVVQVGLSLKGINANLQKIILTSISITVLFLSAALLFTFIAAKRITEPLLRLKQGAESIQEGGVYERIEINAVDEIGHLATSFNMMVDSLRKKDEEIMRHVQELSVLNSVAFTVNQSLDLKSTLQDALEEVLKITKMNAGWIYLPAEENNTYSIAAHRGVDERFVKKADNIEPGEGFAGKVGLTGHAIMLEDLSGDHRISRGAVWDEGFKGFASVPLSSKEKLLGVMNVASYSTHPFTPEEAELLYSIGGLIGTAIENSMLYERVKKQLGEIERAQDKLVHAARLASLGELSANVAHEINNPLTGVLTHTSMLMDNIPDADPSKRRLNIIYDETMRIRYIVRNLLDFARQAEPRMVVVPVVDVIKDSLNLISHLAKNSNVNIVEDYGQEGSPFVSVDTSQIKQVLLNLFNNALYAMPNGGELKIKVTASNEWANIHIRDTGCGIPEEIIPKVFDPFYTTKPETKGTGLGLSVSHGIIEKHGGRIELESEVGKGSLFTVRLPIAA